MGTRYSLSLKEEIIRLYKNKNIPLRKLGKKYGINYKTIWRWVKDKEKIKKEKRMNKKIEKIVFLKEKKPWFTIRDIYDVFKKEHIPISKKFIWRILKKFGFLKDKKEGNLFFSYPLKMPYLTLFQEKINNLIEKKKEDKALMEIKAIINQKSFKKFEHYINLRICFDTLKSLGRGVSVEEYYKLIEILESKFLKERCIFSYVNCLLEKLFLLHWKKEIKDAKKVLNNLKKYINKIKDLEIKFMFHFYRALFFSYQSKTKNGEKSLKECNKIIYRLKSSFYYKIYGDLLTHFERFPQAIKIYEKALEISKLEKEKKTIFSKLAALYALSGEYKKAERMLKMAERIEYGLNVIFFETKGVISFIKGKINESIDYFKKALEIAEKEDLKNHLHISTLNIACCYQALKEEGKAKKMISKYLTLFKRYGFKREYSVREIILGKRKKVFGIFAYILYKMKNTKNKKDFNKLLKLARKKGVEGIVHRFIVFYPSLFPFINKNRFPSGVLNFPIFNPYMPIYKVEFLNKFKIKKNGKKINIYLSPKEKAFLIFLSLNKNNYIPLKNIYFFFWGKEKYFSLKQIIYKLRKSLGIPPSALRLQTSEGEKRLFSSLWLYSDYDDFLTSLSEATLFLKLGEREMAKKEFLKAFSLIKCKPFEKMYDRFSEDKRTEIIFKIKDAFEEFLKTNPKKKEIEMIKKKFGKLKIPSV